MGSWGKGVWAALSGGVDSATAAALLVRQGLRIEAVFMELWDCGLVPRGQKATCCSPGDMADARRVAEHLGVAFRTVNLKGAFREKVIGEFVDSYLKGRTPNPCIRCNQWIKYGALLELALQNGAQGLATGHYARLLRGNAGQPLRLLRGLDKSKDQSYFLFPLGQEQLKRVIWPLGEMNKAEVRELASNWGLPVAQKRESQEVCFLAGGDYREFIKDYLGSVADFPGKITDEKGVELGTHQGVSGFTVGQRRGLGIPWREPLYVLRVLPQEARIVVGPRKSTLSRGLVAGQATWVRGVAPAREFCCQVQIRYRHKPAEARVDPLGNSRFRVTFFRPQSSITPGQAAVLYEGEEVLGGGWIEEVLRD